MDPLFLTIKLEYCSRVGIGSQVETPSYLSLT